MNMTLATRVALFSGTGLLAFVAVGFVLAVTLLPSGGHQLGGLLLGDTDLGPPWLVVALYVVALLLLTRKGWPCRVGAVVMALCGLGYTGSPAQHHRLLVHRRARRHWDLRCGIRDSRPLGR